jgi:hypothetical protein
MRMYPSHVNRLYPSIEVRFRGETVTLKDTMVEASSHPRDEAVS